MPASIGERIRLARKGAGLSQAALAGACNVSQATVSAWEGGGHGPSHQHFEAIAGAVGRDPKQIPRNIDVLVLEPLDFIARVA